MTYNIRNGRGADDRVDLDRIAEVIASFDPDVVALQEVDLGRARSGRVDQAAELGNRLGLDARFAACIEDGGEQYGLATLTRWPVEAAEVIVLPARSAHRRSEPRRALVTRLRWPARERAVIVVNTHLSVLGRERAEQVRALDRALPSADVVVAGDLNCATWGASYRALCGRLRPAAPGARTWPARLPIVQLDHVLFRGALRVLGGGAWTAGPARSASDHLPLVAQLAPLEVA